MSTTIPLSKGALGDIARGVEVDNPIFQILGTKRLTSTESERYRLLLSDGVTSTSFTMLATQLNNMVINNELAEHSIVQITRYAMSNANSQGKPRKIMVVLGIEVKMPGSVVGGKIGNPLPDKNDQNTTTTNPPAPQAPPPVNRPPPNPAGYAATGRTPSNLNNSLSAGIDVVTTPIAALSPYQNKWVIKARVANKSDVRTWTNSRGEGKLFNITVMDDSGEIRCTGFTDTVDKFFDLLEVGKVYYISRGQVKNANKQFNQTRNDYEMTLTMLTEILPCPDDGDDIPLITYDFKPISEIAQRPKDDFVDLLAIVKSVEPVQTITAKATGRELRKREVTLVDMSDVSISLTLWGGQAENFDGENAPIIAVKNVRIGEFNGGKNLSLVSTSLLQVEPDIPEAHNLRGWYNSEGHLKDVKSLSRGVGGFNAEWMLLQEAYDKAVSNNESGVTFLCKGVITMIRHERALYKSCPAESCKKKIIDQSNGMFRCEKCDKEYPNFKYRLLANLNITDWSGNQWVTAFGEDGEKILNIDSQELGELSENQPDDYIEKFGQATFSTYIFKLRLKPETYNDESRIKGVMLQLQPVNFKTYNNHLVSEIKRMAHLQ